MCSEPRLAVRDGTALPWFLAAQTFVTAYPLLFQQFALDADGNKRARLVSFVQEQIRMDGGPSGAAKPDNRAWRKLRKYPHNYG